MQLRTRALQTILLEKGYIEQAAIDELIETYEKKIGPRNGAKVVARAWADPQFRKWLFEDGTAAVGSLDFGVSLPKDTEIRVWDSTAELRYMVVPMRPEGTEGWSEDKLAELVTRDSMIGTGFPKSPKDPS